MPRSLHKARASARPAVVLLFALGATLGCSLTPLAKRTTSFASAASTTARKTSDAYSVVNRVTYQAEVASLVNRYDETGFDPKAIQPFLSGPDLQVRKLLLAGILQYADLLADVSSDRPLTDVDTQAKAVGNSIKSLSADQLSSVKLTSTELNALTTAVDALGRILIERKRRRELPGILRDMRQPIETICLLLQQDIGDPQKGGLRNQLQIAYADLINRQQRYIDDNEDHLSPTEKRDEVRRLPQLALAERHADSALAATATALADLAAAHTALADTANQKDAPSFRVRLATLIGQAEQLDDFYNSLPTT